MRVLLPLIKAPSNTHASNSSLSDQSSSSELWVDDQEEEQGDEGVIFVVENHSQRGRGIEGEEEKADSYCSCEELDNNEADSDRSTAAVLTAASISSKLATQPLVSSTVSSQPAASSLGSSSASAHLQQHKSHSGQLFREGASSLAGVSITSDSTGGASSAKESFLKTASSTAAAATTAPRSSKDSPSKTSLFRTRTTTVSPSSRKRRALDSTTGDSKPASRKKRPALDQKPPPRDLRFEASIGTQNNSSSHTCNGNNNNMVGSRRVASSWRYNDDDRRDSPVSSVEEGGCYHQPRHSRGHHHNPVEDDDGPLENNPASARGDHPVIHKEEPINSNNNTNDLDLLFALDLKKRGLEIREQDGDGNCLFRAISLQVYGDPANHEVIRKQCLDFMERDQEHFSQFVTGEPFLQYIQRKRRDGVHGNNPEIQACSELFNRPIEVYCPENGATPLNIFHAEYKTDDAPIRLSYHDGNHYNAVVDPLVPTAGLGLGLPGLQPGLADKMQVAKAVKESDAVADQMALKRALKESQDDELQRAIKESSLSVEHMYNNKAIALSDMDATYFELEQTALERSMESYTNHEQGRKREASSASGRRRRHGRNSPSHPEIESTRAASIQSNRAVAAMPPRRSTTGPEASIPPAAAASVASVTSSTASASAASRQDCPPPGTADEYPQTVQELVMNGFELTKVVRAYGLIGDNFDDLLAFLMSNAS